MRKHVYLAVLCGLLVLLSGSNAFAEEKLITANNPNSILELAKGYGRASLTKDSVGDPLIEAKMDGLVYNIYFYGCTEGENCGSIQFETGWSEDSRKITLDEINDWNNRKLFAHSLLNKSGNVRLRMDVLLRHGSTEKNLDGYFDVWSTLMKEFQNTVIAKKE